MLDRLMLIFFVFVFGLPVLAAIMAIRIATENSPRKERRAFEVVTRDEQQP